MDQQLDLKIDEFINKLIAEVISARLGANPAEIKTHLYQVVLESLINRLNNDQMDQLESIEPGDPKLEETIAMLAAGTPRFAIEIDDILRKEVDKLKSAS